MSKPYSRKEHENRLKQDAKIAQLQLDAARNAKRLQEIKKEQLLKKQQWEKWLIDNERYRERVAARENERRANWAARFFRASHMSHHLIDHTSLLHLICLFQI